ncbi:phospholipid:diacylglycerol acyltransferase [Nematocida ausubeli]|nr:phospholipid:diacylglycerol acyltransferase [Nematocida ausubeli]
MTRRLERKNCKINKEKEKNHERHGDVYINNLCYACGQQRPRRKKRYFLIGILFALLGYFMKIAYEKAFERTVIMKFIQEMLNSKAILNMNLSDDTKAKILYYAEVAAFAPYDELNEMPGMQAYKKGLVGKHPIVIIPGIANTSLELWRTKQENNSFFRKRIWGSHSTLTFMLHNREEWINSMKLDTETGLDPPGIKVRACSGLESSDFSIPGMWFWWKIVENLSYIGYDAADIHFAAFDWRLGIEELEARDSYFTKLKVDIEILHDRRKEKVLTVAHSMGSLIFHYFMQWVSEIDDKWVDKYIHSAVYIGPPLLGAPKAVGGLLTGEVKDTVDMGAFQYAIVELLFGKKSRHELFRTWGSLVYLLPKGGDNIWTAKGMKHPDLVSIRKITPMQKSSGGMGDYKFINYKDVLSMVKDVLPSYNKTIHEKILNPQKKEDKWANPLETPLPNAPDLTIYSLYGINKPTESGYYFTSRDGVINIDKEISSDQNSVYNGVVLRDGDGTVPVISMGYMGVSGWKKKSLNPHGIRTINREYKHIPSTSLLELRGGKYTAEHVNILGNIDLIEDILEISTGKSLPDKIISNLVEMSEIIDESMGKKKESSTKHSRVDTTG